MAITEFYKVSDETIKGIKNADVDAMTKFYEDNYKILCGNAKKYARNKKLLNHCYEYEFNDLIQQIYVDMPMFDFTNKRTLFFSIRACMWCAPFGGLENIKEMRCNKEYMRAISLDIPCKDKEGNINGNYYLDMFCHSPDIFDQILWLNERIDSEKKFDALLHQIYGTGALYKKAEAYFNGLTLKEARQV
jgi:hypothetical protein